MSSGLRTRLADARLYLCCDARERQGDLPEFLDAVLSGLESGVTLHAMDEACVVDEAATRAKVS